jgi:hypothetical protein
MKLKYLIIGALSIGIFNSCTKDLDRTPANSTTADVLYKTEAGYKQALAKIYGGLALTGNQGPAGSGDLRGLDEGFSSYLRGYFNLQELPTDEAVVGWNDQTIKDFHEMDWSASDNFNRTLYSRIFFQITLANAFIKESSDESLGARGISGADADKVKMYRAEARFLRALSYLHAIDLFGNTTFVTEESGIGAFLPEQKTRAEIFAYIESECKDLEGLMAEPKTNEYARADKAGLWMLMANLYLNAEVYTGSARWADAATYAGKVISAGYSLDPTYANLFKADNNTSPEIIFPVAFDGTRTQTYGGTTFLTHCGVGGTMDPKTFGVNGGWAGYRTTSAFVKKFDDISGNTDKRALFYTNGQSLEISDIGNFSDGYAIAKWKNIKKDGSKPSSYDFADVDFPMYRLAEAYLIAAEAKWHLNNTDPEATALLNKVVERAYGNTSHNFTGALTETIILDERGRELYWEAKRRTDLIRFKRFTTGTYLWPWKGGVASGTAVESFRDLYPIPAPEINSNPNLKQNQGY